jgi:phage FluMu protein Com
MDPCYYIVLQIFIYSIKGETMKTVCQKCNGEFLNLYEGICHQCWNKMNDDSGTGKEELKIYRCPSCDRLLFKGKVASLAMTCPRCNIFIRIPDTQNPKKGDE